MDSVSILTSIIGASIATIGLAVGKDSKISEFRQTWVDALREDVASYCAVSLALFRANLAYSLKDEMHLDIESGASDHLVQEANDLKFRIRLRLDSRKAHTTELKDAMDRLTGLASTALKPSWDVDQAIEEVLLTTEKILDEAWMKVRRGESRFRWTYGFAIMTLVGSIGLLIHHWWLNGAITYLTHKLIRPSIELWKCLTHFSKQSFTFRTLTALSNMRSTCVSRMA